MTGFAIFAHGSRVESANDAVRRASSEFARSGNYPLVEACFLELGKPELTEAIGRLAERGADRVIILPYFLTLGTHLQRDLPRIANEASNIYKSVRITIAEPLDGHPSLVGILLDRAREAANGGGGSESETA